MIAELGLVAVADLINRAADRGLVGIVFRRHDIERPRRGAEERAGADIVHFLVRVTHGQVTAPVPRARGREGDGVGVAVMGVGDDDVAVGPQIDRGLAGHGAQAVIADPAVREELLHAVHHQGLGAIVVIDQVVIGLHAHEVGLQVPVEDVPLAGQEDLPLAGHLEVGRQRDHLAQGRDGDHRAELALLQLLDKARNLIAEVGVIGQVVEPGRAHRIGEAGGAGGFHEACGGAVDHHRGGGVAGVVERRAGEHVGGAAGEQAGAAAELQVRGGPPFGGEPGHHHRQAIDGRGVGEAVPGHEVRVGDRLVVFLIAVDPQAASDLEVVG